MARRWQGTQKNAIGIGDLDMNYAKRTICLLKHSHASKSEAEYCNRLFAMRQNKEIEDFKWQISVQLYVDGKPFRTWKIDFLVYEKDGTISYHECKGFNFSDDNFILKRDIFLMNYPNAKLFINWHPAILNEPLSKLRKRVKQKIGILETIRTKRKKLNLKNHPRWIHKDGRLDIDYTK